MENAPKIVRQNLGIFLVEIRGQFYVVEHDPEKNETKSAWHPDYEKRNKTPRSAVGWTCESIEGVAKGRALASATKGFKQVVDERMRKRFVSVLVSRTLH